MKVFSAKFGGMPHPPMIDFKQSVKVFSTEFSLPTDLRKFSPSKVYCYTTATYRQKLIHWGRKHLKVSRASHNMYAQYYKYST